MLPFIFEWNKAFLPLSNYCSSELWFFGITLDIINQFDVLFMNRSYPTLPWSKHSCTLMLILISVDKCSLIFTTYFGIVHMMWYRRLTELEWLKRKARHTLLSHCGMSFSPISAWKSKWIEKAQLQYQPSRRRQVSHHRRIWVLSCVKTMEHANEESILDLKPRANITRSSKQGCQLPKKRYRLCPSLF